MAPSGLPPPPPPPPPPRSTHKDVQSLLMKQRAIRRRPGDVPFPIPEYGADMINFDNWNQMFLRSCFGGLTMHQFEDTPPKLILDLGCGGGHWALEAARQWPNAQVIGFDLNDIQPQLLQLDAFYMRCLEDAGKSAETLPIVDELASRLRWMHGNLLDGLPFPSDYFDFVHISGIGLGVPEDEWQYVLEEVSRVMQCDGVLEIIEEDLIFPCAPPRPSRKHLAPLNTDFSPRDRKNSSAPPSAFSSRSSMFSDQSSVPDSPDEYRVQKKPSLPTLSESTSTDSYSLLRIDIHGSPEVALSRRDTLSPSDTDLLDSDQDGHPQDHTRLKTAWDAMLSRRFLTASVTTVLPFYLSSFFENVQTHPALQMSIPPGSLVPDSGSRSSGDSFADTFVDLTPSFKRLSDVDTHSIKSTGSSQRTVPYWGRMHLAKTVSTVSACKEAIWEEYEKLYPGDLPPVGLKTMRPKDTRFLPLKNSPREAFETDWGNWEHDMTDRMSMRGRVASEFGWPEPDPSPSWRVWRHRMSSHRDEAPSASLRPGSELCRSLRAFVGWKPAA
ncbi:S-adenosyl-L-methionine-dependent methyltransferase [Mycena pura]|uniref:S-adenosyl-L-methionine-dependent methyltransferase n=1 Tax=Mycena pura TaxID=153505 RepID=A0AAD6YRV3_9AGAR|nr:S-adenosyl-L-methionine-dependent methyltransferase [Mycena pura]